jgi:hypothetical protein
VVGGAASAGLNEKINGRIAKRSSHFILLPLAYLTVRTTVQRCTVHGCYTVACTVIQPKTLFHKSSACLIEAPDTVIRWSFSTTLLTRTVLPDWTAPKARRQCWESQKRYASFVRPLHPAAHT